jgi:zinc D-Ala-D-Ala carboxypeptidase
MKFILVLLLQFVFLTAHTSQPMVSQFVSEKEAFWTNTGLPNVPTKEQRTAIKKVAVEYFDRLRVKAGFPLYISSMFRSPLVNKAVKGAKYSDHQVLKDRDGHYSVAIDIDQDGKKTRIGNRALFFLIMHEFEFQKLIWEFDNPKNSPEAFPTPRWVHVSWSTSPSKNQAKRVYRAVKHGSKTVYLTFQSSGLN